MTDAHEEKETLTVDVLIPAHADRTTTPLFTHTRMKLLEVQPRCYICGAKEHLEAHHYPIERCMAEMIDWEKVKTDAQSGNLGATHVQRTNAQSFDFNGIEANPYRFVDDMNVNGLVVCKTHHIGKDEGVHAMPHPLWIAQKYGKEGYKFSNVEVLHFEQ